MGALRTYLFGQIQKKWEGRKRLTEEEHIGSGWEKRERGRGGGREKYYRYTF